MIPILFVLFFVFLLPNIVSAAEQIDSYQTDLRLSNDGVLYVTETIDYDFGTTPKHGIFRDIPTVIPDTASNWLKERYVAINQITVSRDDNSEQFVVTDMSNGIDIRIGDPDKVISGKHIYQIKYAVLGAIVDFTNGGQGLYWNAIGTDWMVPINKMSATLTADAGVLLEQPVCYSGVFGSSQTCDISAISDGYNFSSTATGSGYGLTIQQKIDPERVAINKLERFKLLMVLAISGAVLLLTTIFVAYRFKFKYRFPGPVIAQYTPYARALPMQAGYIIDGRLDSRDITAAIIYLAQKGNLRIERLEKKVFGFTVSDHKLTLIKNETDSVFLKKIIWLLFLSRPVGSTITLSELRKERGSAPTRLITKKDLIRNLHDAMFDLGLYEKTFRSSLAFFTNRILLPGLLAVFALVYYMTHDISAITGSYVFIAGGILFIILLIVLLFKERRTREGFEAQRYLQGFKLFLSVTDKDRFEFHNDPRGNPETFMEYLPYAIAFGVEKQWAKVFADVTIAQPDWYSSPTSTTFSAIALTDSLDTFSNSFASSLRAASTPASSSGSFGGGSSGGGGGGGGGGSW